MTTAHVTIVAALLVGAGVSAGPPQCASLYGIVTDDEGRAVAGATFRMKELNTGRRIVFETDRHGRFLRAELSPALYELHVQQAGYRTVRETVALRPREQKRLDVKLAPFPPAAEAAFHRGLAALNVDDADMAVEAFEEAVRLAPELPEVHVNLGLVYLRLQRPADAVREVETGEALSRGQRHGQLDAVLSLASTYLATGHTDRATVWYGRALDLQDGWPQALLGLGKCQMSGGEPMKALETFRRVVATVPGSPEASEARALIRDIEVNGGDA